MVGDALREAACVHEDEGGAIGADEIGRSVVDLAPHLVGSHGAEFVARYLDGPTPSHGGVHIDDARIVAEEGRDFLQRLHRGREADALGLRATILLHQPIQPGQCQGEVGTTLIVGDGVDFVHDYGAHAGQHLARPWRQSAE